MLEPLQQWICDISGKTIEKPEDGIIVWRKTTEHLDADHRIVHRDHDPGDGDFASHEELTNYLGPEGLIRMTACLTVGPIQLAQHQPERNSIGDLAAYVDLIRRLHVPYYEEARRRFGDPDIAEQFADSSEIAPYFPERLKEMLPDES